MGAPLQVLAVEPWLGGSHRVFLEAWRARSRHEVRIEGLPARHWKWRMQAAALTLARRAAEAERVPDALLVSDYLDLPRFRGFLPPAWAAVPAVLYLHESQLTYPARPEAGDSPDDLSYGFTNILSVVAADSVVFNTRYHLEAFAAAAREYLGRLPRPRPTAELEDALAKARVVGPGIELEDLPLGPGRGQGPLRVVFNHRWEHDKDPHAFLSAVLAARRESEAEVRVLLLGERAGEDLEAGPIAAHLAELSAAGAIEHQGYAARRRDYCELLGRADLVVSTARHEFFGIAVVEAVAAGCAALVPRELAYPEVLSGLGPETFYRGRAGLLARLVAHAREPQGLRGEGRRAQRREAVLRHGAERTARELDTIVQGVARA